MAANKTKRDFAALLDELLEDAGFHHGPSGRPGASLDYLSVMEELHSGRIVISDDTVAAGYREASEEWRDENVVIAPPIAPALPRPSTDPAAIARELGLPARKKPDELDALRRRFAFSNHPDRVAPELRTIAMERMQIANMLIDEAKRARR